jgi:hypothetical protein
MAKVVLNIFKTEKGEYRAVMQIGNHAEPKSMGTIVYQDGEDLETRGTIGVKDSRGIIRMLNERARKWARENGIPFVHNLDFNPYD